MVKHIGRLIVITLDGHPRPPFPGLSRPGLHLNRNRRGVTLSLPRLYAEVSLDAAVIGIRRYHGLATAVRPR